MIFAILVAFFSLFALLVLHELGHFLLAKKFKVKVEEFGIGFPPRIFAKKIGETLFSLNLLPLGAFVKIEGEEENVDSPLSFRKKPLWQRTLIILGGVISFWVVAIFLLTILAATWGLPTLVFEKEENLQNIKIQIVEVLALSPAQKAGILPFDVIKKLKSDQEEIFPQEIKEIQDFIKKNKEKKIEILILRGKEEKKIQVIPTKEGKIGVALVKSGFKKYPWHLAFLAGIESAGRITLSILKSLGYIFSKIILGKKIEGVELRGPIGIGELVARSFQMGIPYFLSFISLLSIYLAIFNLLPIPAVDGGRLLFLGIEKLRGKPLSVKVEQKINAFFFALLLLLLIFVTFKDLMRLF